MADSISARDRMDLYPPTDWLQHPVHLAVLSANTAEITSLSARGADLNENLRNEGTPLHLAVAQCAVHAPAFEKVVRLLLDCGADVDVCKFASGTPLHMAARLGNVDLAQMLIAHGADVNSQNEDHHRTPLHYAAYCPDPQMAQFLITAGARVDALAHKPPQGMEMSARRFRDLGMTPLHIAAREGHTATAQCLLHAGASITTLTTLTRGQTTEGTNAWQLLLERKNALQENLLEIKPLLLALRPRQSVCSRLLSLLDRAFSFKGRGTK